MRASRLSTSLGAVLLLSVATGCVGVPFASPPLQVAVGTGARSSTIRGDETVYDMPLQLRAAVHPLGFAPKLLPRRADFGVGYLLDSGKAGWLRGPYLEGGGVLVAGPMGEGWGRLSARMQGRLLFDRTGGRMGQGVALQLTGEYGDFVTGPFDSSDHNGGLVGYAFGEGGAGLFIEAAYFRLGETAGWSTTTGVLFRVPASVGFIWMWLTNVL